MNSVVKIPFADLLERLKLNEIAVFHNKLSIFELQLMKERKSEREKIPVRIEAYSVFLIEEGEFRLFIDYIPHTISKHSFLILSEKNVIQLISASEDLRGYNILIEPIYLRGLLKDQLVHTTSRMHSLIRDPSIKLDREDFEILINYIRILILNISRKNNFYQSKIIDNEIINFILEVWNFRMQNESNITEEDKKKDHREVLVIEFVRLLIDNGKREREVAFYADKLNVSPVYLSRSIKHFIGMPAIKLINNFALSDAKLLLQHPGISIKEIAEEMNFSDQASFSKFFKKQTGMSPIKYRTDV